MTPRGEPSVAADELEAELPGVPGEAAESFEARDIGALGIASLACRMARPVFCISVFSCAVDRLFLASTKSS